VTAKSLTRKLAIGYLNGQPSRPAFVARRLGEMLPCFGDFLTPRELFFEHRFYIWRQRQLGQPSIEAYTVLSLDPPNKQVVIMRGVSKGC